MRSLSQWTAREVSQARSLWEPSNSTFQPLGSFPTSIFISFHVPRMQLLSVSIDTRLGWEQSETDGKDLLEESWQEELGGRCVLWLHCALWPDSKSSSIRESRVSPCTWVSRTEIPTQWRKVLSSKYALLFEKMLTHFILHSKQIKAHSSHQGNICKSPIFFPQKSTRKMDAPSIKPHSVSIPELQALLGTRPSLPGETWTSAGKHE